jgi:hypothetical protein
MIFLIFIIQGFIFATFSAVLANSMNRSVPGWFLCGFFFGPLGLVVRAFSKLEPADPTPKLNTTGQVIGACPACGNNMSGLQTCRYCAYVGPAIGEDSDSTASNSLDMPVPAALTDSTLVASIERLSALHKSGALSLDEFAAAKAKLLS